MIAFATLWPTVATAASPAASGWWTLAPATLAADVPADGLLLQSGGDPATPVAFAALRYDLVSGAETATLKLDVAPSSASTPNPTLQACRLTSEFSPTQGGDMADAPSFDCAGSVPSAVSADGSLQFDVLPLARANRLEVAIVAVSPGQRVVLDAPEADSLTVTESTGSLTPGDMTTPMEASPVGAGSTGEPSSLSETTYVLPMTGPVTASPDLAPGGPAARTAESAGSLGSAGLIAAASQGTGWTGWKVVGPLAALAAVALWVVAGRRAPLPTAGGEAAP
jgi:hypothetical protein